MQHTYLKKFAYDGRLIYDTNVALSETATVLDAGTGTGENCPQCCPFSPGDACFFEVFG